MRPFVRTIYQKTQTAIDTYRWLRSIPEPDEDIFYLLQILDCLIGEYSRILAGRAISDNELLRLRAANTHAAELLTRHMEDYPEQLAGFTVVDVPVTAIELIYIVLNQALERFTATLTPLD